MKQVNKSLMSFLVAYALMQILPIVLAHIPNPSVNSQLLDTAQTKWTALSSGRKGDGFSVLIPLDPNLQVTERNPRFEISEANIDKIQSFTAYVGGVLYIVEAYDTSDPKKALKSILDYSYLSGVDKTDIQVNGYKGRQVLHDDSTYYKKVQYIPTKQRVYIIGIATRNKNNPDVNHFLSSLCLGKGVPVPNSTDDLMLGDSIPTLGSNTPASVNSANQIVSSKELTRRAVPIIQRQPNIVGIRGVIKLEVIFSSTVRITDVKVLQGLSPELDEIAVETVKHLKFLPAEKGGQLVSQRLILEYSIS